MPHVVLLLAAWTLVFAINVVPAFMPPSWAVMAVFRITSGLPILPLTLGGAAASALGRMMLARLSARLGHKLPRSDRDNAAALGAFVNRHRHWRALIVFGYCLAPLPSNPLFIAAGVGRVPLLPVTIAFFLSRAIADTFWVWTAGLVATSLGDVFLHSLTSWQSIAVQIVAIVLVVLVFRLPWSRWLGGSGEHRRTTKHPQQESQQETADTTATALPPSGVTATASRRDRPGANGPNGR